MKVVIGTLLTVGVVMVALGQGMIKSKSRLFDLHKEVKKENGISDAARSANLSLGNKLETKFCDKKIADLADPHLRKQPLKWHLRSLVPCQKERKQILAKI